MNNLQVLESWIDDSKENFEKLYQDNYKTFEREKNFVLQIFSNNKRLQEIAVANQERTAHAICTAASMGVTLNPACKEAYLLPRDGKVFFEISYMGALKAAIDDGACIAGKCGIVFSDDEFIINGMFQEPTHKYDPFKKERGTVKGAYAVLKLDEDNFYTETMEIEELNKIRRLNEAERKGRFSPYRSFPLEMMKKTVLKRALKFVKGKSSRVDKIISYLNENGEGIKLVSSNDTPVKISSNTIDAYKKLLNTNKSDDVIEVEKLAEIEKDILKTFKEKLYKLGIKSKDQYDSFLEHANIDDKNNAKLKYFLNSEQSLKYAYNDYVGFVERNCKNDELREAS